MARRVKLLTQRGDLAADSGGPAGYVLWSRLPDDLRSISMQPPLAVKLNHALAMVLLKFDFEVLGFVDRKGKDTDEFVKPAHAYPGTAGLVPGGDIVVRMRQREREN